MNKATEELASRYNSEWVQIPCHNLLEAVERAYATTGNSRVSLAGGDYGHDEDAGEVGMGNSDYTIVVWPNGTAILTVRKIDNARFLYGAMVADVGTMTTVAALSAARRTDFPTVWQALSYVQYNFLLDGVVANDDGFIECFRSGSPDRPFAVITEAIGKITVAYADM